MASNTDASSAIYRWIDRKPLTEAVSWTSREKFWLVTATCHYGTHDWRSVAQVVKNAGEPYRPRDWYTPKSCERQFKVIVSNLSKEQKSLPLTNMLQHIAEDLKNDYIRDANKSKDTLKIKYCNLFSILNRVKQGNLSRNEVVSLYSQARRNEIEGKQYMEQLMTRQNASLVLENSSLLEEPIKWNTPSAPLLTSLLRSRNTIPANRTVTTITSLLQSPGGTSRTRSGKLLPLSSSIRTSQGTPTLSKLLEAPANPYIPSSPQSPQKNKLNEVLGTDKFVGNTFRKENSQPVSLNKVCVDNITSGSYNQINKIDLSISKKQTPKSLVSTMKNGSNSSSAIINLLSDGENEEDSIISIQNIHPKNVFGEKKDGNRIEPRATRSQTRAEGNYKQLNDGKPFDGRKERDTLQQQGTESQIAERNSIDDDLIDIDQIEVEPLVSVQDELITQISPKMTRSSMQRSRISSLADNLHTNKPNNKEISNQMLEEISANFVLNSSLNNLATEYKNAMVGQSRIDNTNISGCLIPIDGSSIKDTILFCKDGQSFPSPDNSLTTFDGNILKQKRIIELKGTNLRCLENRNDTTKYLSISNQPIVVVNKIKKPFNIKLTSDVKDKTNNKQLLNNDMKKTNKRLNHSQNFNQLLDTNSSISDEIIIIDDDNINVDDDKITTKSEDLSKTVKTKATLYTVSNSNNSFISGSSKSTGLQVAEKSKNDKPSWNTYKKNQHILNTSKKKNNLDGSSKISPKINVNSKINESNNRFIKELDFDLEQSISQSSLSELYNGVEEIVEMHSFDNEELNSLIDCGSIENNEAVDQHNTMTLDQGGDSSVSESDSTIGAFDSFAQITKISQKSSKDLKFLNKESKIIKQTKKNMIHEGGLVQLSKIDEDQYAVVSVTGIPILQGVISDVMSKIDSDRDAALKTVNSQSISISTDIVEISSDDDEIVDNVKQISPYVERNIIHEKDIEIQTDKLKKNNDISVIEIDDEYVTKTNKTKKQDFNTQETREKNINKFDTINVKHNTGNLKKELLSTKLLELKSVKSTKDTESQKSEKEENEINVVKNIEDNINKLNDFIEVNAINSKNVEETLQFEKTTKNNEEISSINYEERTMEEQRDNEEKNENKIKHKDEIIRNYSKSENKERCEESEKNDFVVEIMKREKTKIKAQSEVIQKAHRKIEIQKSKEVEIKNAEARMKNIEIVSKISHDVEEIRVIETAKQKAQEIVIEKEREAEIQRAKEFEILKVKEAELKKESELLKSRDNETQIPIVSEPRSIRESGMQELNEAEIKSAIEKKTKTVKDTGIKDIEVQKAEETMEIQRVKTVEIQKTKEAANIQKSKEVQQIKKEDMKRSNEIERDKEFKLSAKEMAEIVNKLKANEAYEKKTDEMKKAKEVDIKNKKEEVVQKTMDRASKRTNEIELHKVKEPVFQTLKCVELQRIKIGDFHQIHIEEPIIINDFEPNKNKEVEIKGKRKMSKTKVIELKKSEENVKLKQFERKRRNQEFEDKTSNNDISVFEEQSKKIKKSICESNKTLIKEIEDEKIILNDQKLMKNAETEVEKVKEIDNKAVEIKNVTRTRVLKTDEKINDSNPVSLNVSNKSSSLTKCFESLLSKSDSTCFGNSSTFKANYKKQTNNAEVDNKHNDSKIGYDNTFDNDSNIDIREHNKKVFNKNNIRGKFKSRGSSSIKQYKTSESKPSTFHKSYDGDDDDDDDDDDDVMKISGGSMIKVQGLDYEVPTHSFNQQYESELSRTESSLKALLSDNNCGKKLTVAVTMLRPFDVPVPKEKDSQHLEKQFAIKTARNEHDMVSTNENPEKPAPKKRGRKRRIDVENEKNKMLNSNKQVFQNNAIIGNKSANKSFNEASSAAKRTKRSFETHSRRGSTINIDDYKLSKKSLRWIYSNVCDKNKYISTIEKEVKNLNSKVAAIIKCPVESKGIRKKINSEEIKTLDDMQAYLLLLTHNTCIISHSNSIVYSNTTNFQKDLLQNIKRLQFKCNRNKKIEDIESLRMTDAIDKSYNNKILFNDESRIFMSDYESDGDDNDDTFYSTDCKNEMITHIYQRFNLSSIDVTSDSEYDSDDSVPQKEMKRESFHSFSDYGDNSNDSDSDSSS